MAFDFDEARKTVEEAKKRGLIRASNEEAPADGQEPPKDKSKGASGDTLPDWLQNVT